MSSRPVTSRVTVGHGRPPRLRSGEGAGPSLIRHLTGDRSADLVGVPPADLTKLAIQLGTLPAFGYGKAGDAVPVAAELASRLGLLVFKNGLLLTNRGRRREWQVPTGLTDSPA